MEQRYLIDSNCLIDYFSASFPEQGMIFMHQVVNNIPNVSVITKIEVLGFNTPVEYNNLLTSFIGEANVIGLTDNVVVQCIALRKRKRIKLPDAIIAATALVGGYQLITRNKSDFKDIDGLSVIDAHVL
jgi:predicted nucleic acid-binding protein